MLTTTGEAHERGRQTEESYWERVPLLQSAKRDDAVSLVLLELPPRTVRPPMTARSIVSERRGA